MKSLPKIENNRQVKLQTNVFFDAWLYNFMIENNYAYHMNQKIIASPEQIAFMVALDKNEVYIPCSDAVFKLIFQPNFSKELHREYWRGWRTIIKVLRKLPLSNGEKQRVHALCRTRYRQLIKSHNIIPSRFMKRMTSLLATQTGIDDPWFELKQKANAKALDIFTSGSLQQALYRAPQNFACSTNLSNLRDEINNIEISRLMYLSAASRHIMHATPSPLEWNDLFLKNTQSIEPFLTLLGAEKDGSKTILFLPDTTGGFVFDMALLKRLQRMGHKIIVALKSGFYFYSPSIQDVESDGIIEELFSGATILQEENISKNKLLRCLQESSMLVIQDGTRERLNLYRANVAFARAWKEADIILAKGVRNAEVLIQNSQQFTRDIVSYWVDENGQCQMVAKARARHVRKLTEGEIRDRAESIISEMRQAHKEGKTVMFYSCIIGSIPGQESVAMELVHTFVHHLRNKLDSTFIVNPAEQLPDGMDGDDLMYMWERVQRSGYINVWRFQTVQDIEDSFALLGRKVLPAWAGKDSTYSTGCTKEMRIAISVQKSNPEMQIIGPDQEKFFRRNNYGIGKFFDARI